MCGKGGNASSLEIHRKCLVMQGKKPGEKENGKTASMPRNMFANVERFYNQFSLFCGRYSEGKCGKGGGRADRRSSRKMNERRLYCFYGQKHDCSPENDLKSLIFFFSLVQLSC